MTITGPVAKGTTVTSGPLQWLKGDVAGPPTDAEFTTLGVTSVTDGLRCLNTIDGFAYERSGGVWIRLNAGPVKTKAGVPVDADFSSPTDGLLELNTSNLSPYTRSGGSWFAQQLRRHNAVSYIVWFDGTNYRADSMIGTTDYTNADAATVINNALGAMGGGKLLIRKGTYTINTAIQIKPANNGVEIMGEGALTHDADVRTVDRTILVPGANVDIFQVLPTGSTNGTDVTGISISNFVIVDTNSKQTSTGGIKLDNANGVIRDCTIENVTMELMGYRGIYTSVAGASVDGNHFLDTGLLRRCSVALRANTGTVAFQLGGAVAYYLTECVTFLTFQAGPSQIGYDLYCGSTTPTLVQGLILSNCESNTNQNPTAIGYRFTAVNEVWAVNSQTDVGSEGFQFNQTCQNMTFSQCIATGTIGFHFMATCTSVGIAINGAHISNTATTGFKSETGDTSTKFIVGGNNQAATAFSPNPLTGATIHGMTGPTGPLTGWAGYVGIDNRSVSANDGSPVTIYTSPTGATQVYRVSGHAYCTAYTSGTIQYTIGWTENAQAKTAVLTATLTATNTFSDIRSQLIKPDASTAVTAQVTGITTATVTVASIVERFA